MSFSTFKWEYFETLDSSTSFSLVQTKKKKSFNYSNFKGVTLKDISKLEELFHININIYELTNEDRVVTHYTSMGRFPSTMYLNVVGKHFTYIKSINAIHKKFECRLCSKIFKTNTGCKRHERTCSAGIKTKLPGGFYNLPETIFERLTQYGIDVDEELQILPIFYCF
jgi:hypothetical protein